MTDTIRRRSATRPCAWEAGTVTWVNELTSLGLSGVLSEAELTAAAMPVQAQRS